MEPATSEPPKNVRGESAALQNFVEPTNLDAKKRLPLEDFYDVCGIDVASIPHTRCLSVLWFPVMVVMLVLAIGTFGLGLVLFAPLFVARSAAVQRAYDATVARVQDRGAVWARRQDALYVLQGDNVYVVENEGMWGMWAYVHRVC